VSTRRTFIWNASVVPLLWSTVACARSQPLAAPAGAHPPTGAATAAAGAAMGFDFLQGRWRVRNRRLVARLQASTQWQEFDAELEGQRLMGGIANVDCLHIPRFVDGKPLDVLDLKVFDPEAHTWTLIQADSRSGQLGKPLVGRFSAGRGEFFCDDTVDGKPIRVVSRWSDISSTSVRWEQAFSPDAGTTWETNWQAELTREA
jgi:hypothetical protein